MDDYVPDICRCAKLNYDTIRGSCPSHMRNCLSNVHTASFLGVHPTRYLLSRCAYFDDQKILVRGKTSFRARKCLLRIPKTKSYILTQVSQKREFSVDFRRERKFRLSKHSYATVLRKVQFGTSHLYDVTVDNPVCDVIEV